MAKSTNRLNLDFSIQDATARNQYVKHFLEETGIVPTAKESETIANYILWGKDEDGKSPAQKKEIQIETRAKTWDRKDIESLDELKESASFNEAAVHELNASGAKPKVVRKIFCREDVERLVPEKDRPLFYELFDRIDYYDALVGFYDLENGKRDNEVREDLLERLDASTIKQLKERAASLDQYSYLKIKHLLVELRKEQFMLLDSYKAHLVKQDNRFYEEEPSGIFDYDIPVLPLGIKKKGSADYIFLPLSQLVGFVGDEKALEKVSEQIWRVREHAENYSQSFDFRDCEHIYNLILMYNEFKYSSENEKVDSTLDMMLATLDFYVELADLDEIQTTILELKKKRVKNPEIAAEVNEKYGTSYTNNYISTIFRQKIIAKIAEAARYHEKIVDSLFYEEKFKRCNCCGRLLLADEENFVRKARSVDGFANRCKDCDRIDRIKRKEA